MKTRELLRAHVITISESATLQDAIDRFDLYQATELPVVDEDGNFVGLLVASDVCPKLMSTFSGAPNDKLKNDGISIYSRKPVFVQEGDDVHIALKLLLEEDLHRIPIVHERRVVGTIGRVDICQAILDGSLSAV